MPCPDPSREESDVSVNMNTGPYIAYDGTLGHLWTIVVRTWDAARTAWMGVATVGQIASSAEHAIALVQRNGPWPEGAEFIPYEPGSLIGAMVWGQRS